MPSWSAECEFHNLGALPIIARVSLTHTPYLFACFYDFVSCVCAFCSTCLSICISCAACFVLYSIFITTDFTFKICTHTLPHMLLFHFHVHAYTPYSCVCIPPHLYALTPLLIYLHACLHMYLHTYFCPFYRHLIFPYVFPYVYVSVCECTKMFLHVHFCITHNLLVFVSCVYVSFSTCPCICVLHDAPFVFRACTISTNTFVLKTIQRWKKEKKNIYTYVYICISWV